MTDEEFAEFIAEVNADDKPVYVLGYCCGAVDDANDGADMSYRSICPCPSIFKFCVSESKPKILSGLSDGSRYYGKLEKTIYSVGPVSGPDAVTTINPERGWGSSVTATDNGLKETVTTNCNFDRDEDGVRISPLTGNTETSYSGSVSVSGSHLYCTDLSEEYEYEGDLDVVFHYDIDGDLSWNGGASASASGQVGLFKFYDFVTSGCAEDPSEFSYTNTHNPTGGAPFTVTSDVGEPSLSTYSECPSWCDAEDSEGNVVDPVKGNECVTFRACGACNTNVPNPSVDFVTVDFCFIITNLRCGESYQGCYQIQKRSYLAFCDVEEQNNWFLHEVEQFNFTAQAEFHIVGGNLRVMEEDFVNANYSTSIYDYRDYFFRGYDDEGEEVWDTDADVITPTLGLPQEQGEQYRADAVNLWRTGDGDCPTDLDEEFECPFDIND